MDLFGITWDGAAIPILSVPALNLVRSGYGLLLLLTLLHALPNARRFFLTQAWGGYTDDTWRERMLQNPVGLVAIQSIWFACAAGLISGVWSVGAALINAAICRYFFISMRWSGAQRGMGAPGFICHWLGNAVFWLELCRYSFPDVLPIVLLTLQIDCAVIFLSAGFYKLRSGYAQNAGMEFGLVNPQWGYWWRYLKGLSPQHIAFRVFNHLGWSMEILAALLMVIPATRFYGGLLLILSFGFVAATVRLSWLGEMVMLMGVLFFVHGSLGGQFIDSVAGWVPASQNFGLTVPGWVGTLVGFAFIAYLILMPVAYAGMVVNFYGKKRMAQPFQRVLEVYTNAFGMILWRVFSVDLTNFFVNIHLQDLSGNRRTISRWGKILDLRYNHVCESITVTCLFTLLKYFPGDKALFHSRIQRYSATLRAASADRVVYEVISIRKDEDCFSFAPVLEVSVNVAEGKVEETVVDPTYDFTKGHVVSPIQPGGRLGSYAPSEEKSSAEKART